MPMYVLVTRIYITNLEHLTGGKMGFSVLRIRIAYHSSMCIEFRHHTNITDAELCLVGRYLADWAPVYRWDKCKTETRQDKLFILQELAVVSKSWSLLLRGQQTPFLYRRWWSDSYPTMLWLCHVLRMCSVMVEPRVTFGYLRDCNSFTTDFKLPNAHGAPPATHIHVENEKYNNDHNNSNYDTCNSTMAWRFWRFMSRDFASSGENLVPISYLVYTPKLRGVGLTLGSETWLYAFVVFCSSLLACWRQDLDTERLVISNPAPMRDGIFISLGTSSGTERALL